MKKTDRKTPSRQVPVQVSLEDLLRCELHAFAIEAGLRVVAALLEGERTAVCGPRYRHDQERGAYRAGHAPGELILGGRRVRVPRPRARTVVGQEVELPSWQAFSAADPLQKRTVEQMVLGVATRRYGRSLEPVPDALLCRGQSKSAVSRRFVAATEAKLQELLSKPLDGIALRVLFIDGLHFADHVVLVALGIDAQGRKHILGLQEGATENHAACRALLVHLRERGLCSEHSLLVVMDGSQALAKAVRAVFGERALLQRCQVHKKRNVLDHLPKGMRGSVGAALSQAYGTRDPQRARQLLLNLARRLAPEHPGAAASLQEGLEETLTVMGLGLPVSLERLLSTTNAIENLLGTVRSVSRRVKRWKGGGMILRWIAAGMEEAAKGFRRVRGYQGMARLDQALRHNDARIDAKAKTEEAA